MTNHELESTCERLIGRSPVYVVFRSELGPPTDGPGVFGVASEYLAWMLRPQLERAGRWRGPGGVVVVDIARIAGAARTRPPGIRRRWFRMTAYSIIVHELAHVALMAPAPEPTAGVVQMARATMAEDVDGAATRIPESTPWLHHELPFIRVALNLAYRARRLGLPVDPWEVANTSSYCLSHTSRYERALWPEIDANPHTPLAELLATEPPPAFAAVWEADIQEHARRCAASSIQDPGFSKGLGMIQQLVQTLAARKKARATDFLGMARDVAAGRTVPIERIEEILLATGKEPEDFEKAVQLFERRHALARDIENAANAERDIAAANAAIEKAAAKLRAAEEAYEATVGPLEHQVRTLRQRQREAGEARARLFVECPYPELRQRYDEVRKELNELESEAFKLQKDIDDGAPERLREWRMSATTRAVNFRGNYDVLPGMSSNLNHADRLERSAKAAQARLAAITPRLEELRRESETLEERMREV